MKRPTAIMLVADCRFLYLRLWSRLAACMYSRTETCHDCLPGPAHGQL